MISAHQARNSLAALAGLFALIFTVNAAPDNAAPLDFELSDGSRFIRLAALEARPTLVNFWRADCPPCVRELPLFAELARQNRLRVATVALQRPADTLNAPPAARAALTTAGLLSLHGPSEPRGLLARFGNPHGALPHTVLLDARRRPCAVRTGEVDAAWLAAALNHCAPAS